MDRAKDPPGAWADVIAVEGNPVDDPAALERVRFVMARGTVIKWSATTSP